MLIDELLTRKTFLESVIRLASKTNYDPSDGYIRGTLRNGNIRYYLKRPGTGGCGTYLSESQKDIAVRLVQCKYNNDVLIAAREELKQIEKMIMLENMNKLTAAYEKLGKYRKPLVTPYKVSNEEYAQIWLNQDFKKRKPGAEEAIHFSSKGELMHSGGEVIISAICDKLKIPYLYEKPTRIFNPDSDKNETWYPDFTMLNIRTRKKFTVEYFGMMGDEGYRKKAINKIRIYEENGYYAGKNFIPVFNGGDFVFDERRIENTFREYLL